MDQIRVGFIGCGAHSTMNLYPCFQYAPLELVSVCDLDEERRLRAKTLFGAEAAFGSIDELLKGPPIDSVFICGPPEMHSEAAVAALDAGFPVFMEKPPAGDLTGALKVQAAARANKRQCMVGFMKRFALRSQQAKEIVDSEDFGDLTQVTVKYSHWNFNNLHDMLVYMSVHPLDLMRFFLGDLERVTIEKCEREGQYTFTLLMRSKTGAIGNLIQSSHEPRLKEHLELVGEGELVVVPNVVGLEYHKRVAPDRTFGRSSGDIELVRPDFGIPNPEQDTLFLRGYVGEIQEFAQSVIEDRAPSVTIDDGVMAMRLVELMRDTENHATYDVGDWSQ